MEPVPPARDQARFDLCVRRDGSILKRTPTTLVLSDAGIDYAIDGRSGLRPYSGLRSIRIQLTSPAPHLSARVQLDFARGRPLFVYSHTPEGEISPEQSRVFVAFLTELHRRLGPQDRARIDFRSGVSPIRHKLLLACSLVIAVPVVVMLVLALFGQVPIGKVVWPLVPGGLLAAGLVKAALWSRPGTYEPDRLPEGLMRPA